MLKQNIRFRAKDESRPKHYPVPMEDGQLFFIQRNLSLNSVVYCINRTPDNLINLSDPMKVYWIRYEDDGSRRPLNFIQEKLAYGYKFEVINCDLIKFSFVCHDKPFYISKMGDDYRVVSQFDNEYHIINSLFVHAEESGAFPVIHFVEADLTKLNQSECCKKRLEFLN